MRLDREAVQTRVIIPMWEADMSIDTMRVEAHDLKENKLVKLGVYGIILIAAK